MMNLKGLRQRVFRKRVHVIVQHSRRSSMVGAKTRFGGNERLVLPYFQDHLSWKKMMRKTFGSIYTYLKRREQHWNNYGLLIKAGGWITKNRQRISFICGAAMTNAGYSKFSRNKYTDLAEDLLLSIPADFDDEAKARCGIAFIKRARIRSHQHFGSFKRRIDNRRCFLGRFSNVTRLWHYCRH